MVQTAGGCHLTWVMAMKPKGVAAKFGMTLGRPVMAWTFQKFLYNLRDYRKALRDESESSTFRPRRASLAVGIGDDLVAGRPDHAREASLGVVHRPVLSWTTELPRLPALRREVQPGPLHAFADRRWQPVPE